MSRGFASWQMFLFISLDVGEAPTAQLAQFAILETQELCQIRV